jgi:hypothetical protein
MVAHDQPNTARQNRRSMIAAFIMRVGQRRNPLCAHSPRRRAVPWVTSLLAAVVVSACARTAYDPFKTPAAELRSRVRTIALAPLVASAAFVDNPAARARLEPIVSEQLRTGGFAIVPSEEMEALWRRAAEDLGGIYDPITGEAKKETFEAVKSTVFRELAGQRSVDAVLYLVISPVPLSLPGPNVTYCGTETADPLYWPTSGEPLRESATLALVLCLSAVLYDIEGRELYGIRHGLETVETYAVQTRAVRPLAERLQNEVRLLEAVKATVGPLAAGGKT